MIISLIQALAFLLIFIFDFHKRHKKYKDIGYEVYYKFKYGYTIFIIPIPLWLVSIPGLIFFC